MVTKAQGVLVLYQNPFTSKKYAGMKKVFEGAVIITLYVLSRPLPYIRKAMRYIKRKNRYKNTLLQMQPAE
jgi:hypothetical protein